MPLAASEVLRDAAREELRALVLDEGFDRVGFAAAGLAPSADRFAAWLEHRQHGNMSYLARSSERRMDPRRVLPGARTVIVAALHYATPPAPHAPESGPRGRIAAFARGEDYHRVLESRLRRVTARIREQFSAEARYYVDTGPVLEKDWAATAGVGWIGKNTCVIDPERGSFFFLGVILTTLGVDPDAPSLDHCGSCTACLDACPTGAFRGAWDLDARRCISYLTIEHRGELPEALESSLDGWIFGCDVCQDVCPFNHPERQRADPKLEPRPENLSPSLLELAGLDRAAFIARFPRSAVRRARVDGLLRNVIAAVRTCGEEGRAECIERLAENPVVRSTPALALALEKARPVPGPASTSWPDPRGDLP